MNPTLLKILTQMGLAMKQPDFTKRQFHEPTRAHSGGSSYTKNHSVGESKTRRRMVARSRKINRRYQ